MQDNNIYQVGNLTNKTDKSFDNPTVNRVYLPREFHLQLILDRGKKQMDEAERLSKMSNTQLYKQAGNSIVVDVLYHIYKELYAAMPYLFDNLEVGSYFSGIGAFEKGLDRLYADINK